MIFHQLVITIVRKGRARKVVEAAKAAGAEGGTTVPGRGTGRRPNNFLGLTMEPEKEVIFTLIPENLVQPVLAAVTRAGEFDKRGNGIAFVIEICRVIGIAHLAEVCQCNSGGFMDKHQYQLIVTVVDKGRAELVVEAARRNGAGGGTIIYGRGTGIHEHAKLFSIPIEPEKEVVLTLIDRDKSEAVLAAIRADTGLDEPGKGIAFVIPVSETAGISRTSDPN